MNANEPRRAMMIDIETLSLSPQAYVTQVGVCVADLITREYFVQPSNYWIADTQPSTARIDIDTIKWWMTQPGAGRRSVFHPPEGRYTAPGTLFGDLHAMVQAHDCSVWGSPAMFDLPILTHLFGDKKPWMYNVERDMMTLYKLIDPLGRLAPPPNELQHDAASDAAWQMEYLLNLSARLRGAIQET